MPSISANVNLTGRKALFLDRDGVINFDNGYTNAIGDFEFIPGIFDLIKFANSRDYKVIVVTNQSGIGRGLYTTSQFHKLTSWMVSKFKEQECYVDDVYFCPFHKDASISVYRRWSFSRKPYPGMFLKAIFKHQINPRKSIIIGDKDSDLLAGRRCLVGKLVKFGIESEIKTAELINNLSDAKRFL